MDRRFCGGLERIKFFNLSFNKNYAYNVLEARFVSSCFNCPSRASPHLSLLSNDSNEQLNKRKRSHDNSVLPFSNGVKVKTFDNVKPGWTWHPSLQRWKLALTMLLNSLWDFYSLRFYFRDGALVLRRREQADVSELPHGDFNFLHCFTWIVGDMNIDCYALSMVIKLILGNVWVLIAWKLSIMSLLTSLSKLASKWILFGFSINSLLTSIDGCSPSLEGAYIIFLMANLTEFRLCGLSSEHSPTNAFSS